MKNAAEMALAEFQNPNIQLLIKDDGGSPQGAQQVTAAGARRGRRNHSGPAVRGLGAGDRATDARARRSGDRVLDRFERGGPRRLSARASCRNPTSTGSSITPPASERNRSRRCCRTTPTAMWWKPPSSRRSAAAAAASSRSRNTPPIVPAAARTVAQSLGSADALFIADDGESVVATADALTAAGANLRNIQLLGTGLWDNPRVYAQSGAAGRALCRAGSVGLPRVLRPLPQRNTALTRCVPRRSPMTRSRWSPRCRSRAANVLRRKR